MIFLWIGIPVIAILVFRWYFSVKRIFKTEKKRNLQVDYKQENITESMLQGLPDLLQKYLRLVGVVGKPRVYSFHVLMSGEMRMNKEEPFAPVKADQYSFIESGVRLFFITMKYMHVIISGLHHYNKSDAYMRIKILDLIKVIDHSGPIMHKAETVTYFNDLCIMAPGGLLEEDITWKDLDEYRIEGTLKKHGYEVRAVITFDDEGKLIDFISEDRLAINSEGGYDQIPWSTPISQYDYKDGYYLPKLGQAKWHYPDGDYTYAKIDIESVTINP